MNTLSKAVVLSLAGVGLAVMVACESNHSSRTERSENQKVGITLSGPGREVKAGDTATFEANSRNAYGRDVKITWSSTGGRISTEDKGRLARVRFDEPGTYTVRAMLEVDGSLVQTEAYDVRVMPVR